jgi:uncharacterized membrane protein
MLFARLAVLFVHVTAVIVALGASLFSTFALAPILATELDPVARMKVSRRIVRRLGVIVLSALAILVATGMANLYSIGTLPPLLVVKLPLVAIVIILALYQYGALGFMIWRRSANGPTAEVAKLQERFRRVGLIVGALVLIVVFVSLCMTRIPGAMATP